MRMWLVMVVVMLWPAVGAAQDVGVTVDAMLSGVERTSTDEEWVALGDAAVGPLIARMNDASRSVVERGRATTALGNFRAAEVSVALRAVLADAASPALLIRKAIQSLAKVEGAAAVDAISPHLAHRTAIVREDAIKALGGLVIHPEARAALEKRRAAEPLEHLKRQIEVNLQPTVEAPQ